MGRAAVFTPPDLVSTGILARAKKENKWNKAQADEARQWYEHFLELNWANPSGSIEVLGAKADRLWHTHTTFTARYRTYCEAVLGFFLDHTPTIPPRTLTAADRQAAAAAYAQWGVLPDMIVACHN